MIGSKVKFKKISERLFNLLAGTPRGGIQTWKSLIKYVKNPLDCDIALVYGHIFEMPKYLLNHSKFDWQFEEPENWRDFMKKIFLIQMQ